MDEKKNVEHLEEIIALLGLNFLKILEFGYTGRWRSKVMFSQLPKTKLSNFLSECHSPMNFKDLATL